VKAFASFFKNYMSVSAFVVAALPIPATALGAIDILSDDRRMLSVFTSLFCFLTLGFIFYQRHGLARWMFPEFTTNRDGGDSYINRIRFLKRLMMAMLPFWLIISAATFAALYLDAIDTVIHEITRSHPDTIVKRVDALSFDLLVRTRSSNAARFYYVGMFVCAEAAFILMATKEYLQDLLKLNDVEIMLGHRFRVANPKAFENEAQLYS
jgi:hypothetical protein